MGKNDFGSKDKSFDKSGAQKQGQTQQSGQKTPQQTNLGGGARQERPANINQQTQKPKQPWTQTGSMSDKDKDKNKK